MIINFNNPKTTVRFWRNPTKEERKLGNRGLRYVDVPITQALNSDGTIKKCIKWKDGHDYCY